MQIINTQSPESQALLGQIVDNTLPLSYSSIKRLLDSPYRFFEHKLTPPNETNPLMLGKLFDEVILANEHTKDRILIAPKDANGNELNGNTKAFQQLKEQAAVANKLLVREADYQDAEIIYNRLKMGIGRSIIINALFDPTTQRKHAFTTTAHFKDIEGESFTIPLRGELDAYAPDYDMIIDLKSSSRAKFYGYAREFEALNYDLQGAVYAYAKFGAHQASTGAYEFAHILIDTNAGDFELYEIPPHRKRHGYELFKAGIAIYREIQIKLQIFGQELFEDYCKFQPNFNSKILY
jgi:hypothetical protein